MLLDHGVEPLQHDDDCQTPISLAALNGHTDVVKLFLDYNIDPNPRDIHSKIPLIEASYGGHHETVRLLLSRGAHPDPKDTFGRTPFLWACYNGSVEVVRILLDHSVANCCIDHGWRDSQANTAVSFALDRGHHDIIQLLREKGVLIEQESFIDEFFATGPPMLGGTMSQRTCHILDEQLAGLSLRHTQCQTASINLVRQDSNVQSVLENYILVLLS
ncbi:hypothetical protein N7488_004681 [Penicillium malachiteum]|nr:hypothetical protein N7488_004681 [Penicillium malachiteum]